MVGGGAWERSYAVGDKQVGDGGSDGGGGGVGAVVNDRKRVNRTVEVAVAAAITVVFGVGNRVLYKLALVPLKHYPFFLAQLATFGYLPPSTFTLFFFPAINSIILP